MRFGALIAISGALVVVLALAGQDKLLCTGKLIGGCPAGDH